MQNSKYRTITNFITAITTIIISITAKGRVNALFIVTCKLKKWTSRI